jgi:hypothetical protein
MADAGPSTSAPKGGKGKAAAEEAQPRAPFKPGKVGLYERQVVDYVKTATAKNIWYYRCPAPRSPPCAATPRDPHPPPLTPPPARRPPAARRDRLSTPRGPCSLPVMREAWVNGVIDENTLVWGQGLADWLPVKNVRTLVPQIRTMEGERAAPGLLCAALVTSAHAAQNRAAACLEECMPPRREVPG